MTRCSLVLVLVSVFSAPADAQEPSRSFDELVASGALSSGTDVRVIDRDGIAIAGPTQSISANGLVVRVGGSLRQVDAVLVLEIGRRHDDSVWNGIALGLAGGLAAGVILARANCDRPDDECLAITTLAFVPTVTAGGAVAGWLIDRQIRGYDTVYHAPNSSGPAGLTIRPLFGRRLRGVRVSFSF